MKKRILLTAVFAFNVVFIWAQISLEHTYNYSATIVKLESMGYKYYLMDVPKAQCRIYNIDHSLLKTINCPVPQDYFLADIKLVSENLFNSDASVELACTYYKYVPTQTTYYYMYGTRIINEAGSILLNIDGARYIYINKAGDNLYKLFTYCYDYSVFPEKVWTNIYSVPGVPVVAQAFSAGREDLWAKAFPNPAAEFVKITYQLPEKIDKGTLRLFDSSGRQVNQFIVDHHSDHLDLDINELSQGVYHYFIEYENSRTPSGKLVVQKN